MTEAVWIALIVNTSGLIGLLIKTIKDSRAKRAGNNPHPCQEHKEKLEKLDNRLDAVEKEQAKRGQKIDDMCRILDRVENKLNGMK